MLATVEEFTVRLNRPLDEREIPRVEAIMGDVSSLALGQSGASWTPENVPADVRAVILSASLRQFKNPERYVMEDVGDYSARIHNSEFEAGVFTKAEQAVLERNSQSQSSWPAGFGTIGRTRDGDGPVENQAEHWPVDYGGQPIRYLPKDRWY